MKKFLIISIVMFSFSLLNPNAFAEGGGGVNCPQVSGEFTYIPGSASYTINPFEGGEVGVLFCEYETESEDIEIEPFGDVTAIFHLSGELSEELISYPAQRYGSIRRFPGAAGGPKSGPP